MALLLHILLLHLGGNDLSFVNGKALILQAQADFRMIQERWPGVHIIWSGMFPHLVWWTAWDPKAIERACWKANWEVGRTLWMDLSHICPTPEIWDEFYVLYRGGGVHLSVKGKQIFFDN